MPNNRRNYPYLIFKIALISLIAVLPWSRALTNIFLGLLLVSAFSEVFINKTKISWNVYFVCLCLLVLFCLLDAIRAESLSDWFSYFNIKFPLVLYAFVIIVFKNKISSQLIKNVSIIFSVAITSATVASSLNYFLNYSELNALVLQSKPIPIMGEIHHITFSVYCAFTVIVSAYYAYNFKIKWLGIFTFINLIGLHILAARTGLVGFYFACMILGVVYILKHKPKIKYLAVSLAMICILPIAAFYGISSFHNRILNSWEDIKVIWHQKDANYQSMGMRIEASKTALDLVKKYPITGVGCNNIKKAMSIQYEENNTNLFIENRILPHNQFVIEAAIHGIIGLAVLLLFFLFPLFNNFLQLPTLFIAFWSIVLFACMFECLFDRQHGVILVSLFWFFYYNFKPAEEKIE